MKHHRRVGGCIQTVLHLSGWLPKKSSLGCRHLSARHRHGEGKRHSVSFKGTDSTPDFKKYPQHRLCLSSVIAMTAECLREVSCPRTFQQPGMPDHFFRPIWTQTCCPGTNWQNPWTVGACASISGMQGHESQSQSMSAFFCTV